MEIIISFAYLQICSSLSQYHHPLLYRPAEHRVEITEPHFPEHILSVRLHRKFTDKKHIGNFAAAIASRHKLKDFAFTLAEHGVGNRWSFKS